MTILETKNLKKYYGKGDTQVKALDGVNLSVEDGEFVAIVGTSGSGKSTLLHMLGGLDRPTSGSVTVDGKNIFSLKDEALTIFRRRKIGFVFQSFNGNVKKCAVGKHPKSEKLGSTGQAACCARIHSRYFTGGSPSGLRV